MDYSSQIHIFASQGFSVPFFPFMGSKVDRKTLASEFQGHSQNLTWIKKHNSGNFIRFSHVTAVWINAYFSH